MVKINALDINFAANGLWLAAMLLFIECPARICRLIKFNVQNFFKCPYESGRAENAAQTHVVEVLYVVPASAKPLVMDWASFVSRLSDSSSLLIV